METSDDTLAVLLTDSVVCLADLFGWRPVSAAQ
jgi:hypothetical protein